MSGEEARFEKIAIFALQRFPEARRKAPTEGIKWESGANPEQFPLLYVPAPPLRGERVRLSLATDFWVGKASQTERVRRPAVAVRNFAPAGNGRRSETASRIKVNAI